VCMVSIKIKVVSVLNTPRKTFAQGIITTIESTRELAKSLLNKKDRSLDNFLTDKTSQDHLELFFAHKFEIFAAKRT